MELYASALCEDRAGRPSQADVGTSKGFSDQVIPELDSSKVSSWMGCPRSRDLFA